MFSIGQTRDPPKREVVTTFSSDDHDKNVKTIRTFIDTHFNVRSIHIKLDDSHFLLYNVKEIDLEAINLLKQNLKDSNYTLKGTKCSKCYWKTTASRKEKAKKFNVVIDIYLK